MQIYYSDFIFMLGGLYFLEISEHSSIIEVAFLFDGKNRPFSNKTGFTIYEEQTLGRNIH